VLLQLRAEWTHEGGTWALPGGAINLVEGRRESAEEAATREAWEEAGIDSSQITVVGSEVTTDHGTWTYTTVVARTEGDAGAHIANAESKALDWVPIDVVDQRPLHSGFAAAWPVLRQKILDSLA
jgi:ADP-ribose pyrophosphatase YjhB (NUDIX family)